MTIEEQHGDSLYITPKEVRMYIDTNIHIGDNDTLTVSYSKLGRVLIDYSDDVVIYMPTDKAQELLKKLKDVLLQQGGQDENA